MTTHDKIVFELALSFYENKMFTPRASDLDQIALLLKVDDDWLRDAIDGNYQLLTPYYNPYEVMFHGEKIVVDADAYTLFALICYYYWISKELDGMDATITDPDILRDTVEGFLYVEHDFEMANSFAGTYQFMKDHIWTYDTVLYANGDFDPRGEYQAYMAAVYHPELFPVGVVQLMQESLSYEFSTRSKALYLITILRILINSKQTSNYIKDIATDLYLNNITLLRNGRIIDIASNLKYHDQKVPFQQRKKNNSETTRMEICYGYENYDSYFLRLDLAHKGEGFIHYNNVTPGDVKSCLFAENEYQSAIKKYPDTEPFFIKYDKRYALKERIHCKFTSDSKDHYEELREHKEHDPVFNNDYTEDNVLEFIDEFTKFLPARCLRPIDKDGTRKRYLFNHNKLMGGVQRITILILAKNKHVYDEYHEFASAAVRYGLITTDETRKFENIDGILEILKRSKSRIE